MGSVSALTLLIPVAANLGGKTGYPYYLVIIRCMTPLQFSSYIDHLCHRSRKKYHVLLHCPARYGYENILRQIFERSDHRWPVHVSSAKFNTYLCHDVLSDSTDSDSSIAQFVHACFPRGPPAKVENCSNYLPCMKDTQGLARTILVLHIKPSAMYFTSDKLDNVSCNVSGRSKDCQNWRVCYSTHSSYSELKQFVTQFPAKKIIPTVVPRKVAEEEFIEEFNAFVRSISPADEAKRPGGRIDYGLDEYQQCDNLKRKEESSNEELPPSKSLKKEDSLKLVLEEDSPNLLEDIEENDENKSQEN